MTMLFNYDLLNILVLYKKYSAFNVKYFKFITKVVYNYCH